MTKALWAIMALLWILAVLDALEPGQGRFKFVPNLPALVEIKTDGSDPNDRTETPLPGTHHHRIDGDRGDTTRPDGA